MLFQRVSISVSQNLQTTQDSSLLKSRAAVVQTQHKPDPASTIPEAGKVAENASSFQANLTRIPVRQSSAFPIQTLVQAKLAIGQPGDRYEQEADRVAHQVVQQMYSSPTLGLMPPRRLVQPLEGAMLQRETTPPKEEDDDEKLQMKPVQLSSQRQFDGNATAATPELQASIQQARGNGYPLPDTIRVSMERSFGADFSHVRVHTDAQSDRLNHSIQAKAFTTGNDIFFRHGGYDPNHRRGQELIAHELTHVIQQNGDQKSATSELIQRNGGGLQSVGATALDLAGGDVEKTSFFTSVLKIYGYVEVRRVYSQLPEAFTSEMRSEMTMQFILEAGGTSELAGYALQKHPQDNQALLDLMQFLLLVQGVLQGATLNPSQLDIVIDHQADLQKDRAALGRVVEMITAAKDVETARLNVEQSKTFDYHLDAYQAAHQYRTEQGKAYRTTKTQDLTQWVEKEKQKVTDQKRGELLAGAVNPETERPYLNKDEMERAQQKDEPFLKSDREKWVKAKGKLNTEAQKLAQGRITEIEQEKSTRETQIEQETGVVSQTAMDEYRNYMVLANYHPKATTALKMVKHDFAFALQIMRAIQADPTIETLLLRSKLDISQINRCLGIPATEIGAILGQITTEEFKVFITSDDRLAILRSLHGAGVASNKIKALSTRPTTFNSYITDTTARGNFVTLLGVYTLSEIDDLLKATPPEGNQAIKMTTLAALQPKAATANDLQIGLDLCKRLQWNATKIQAVFGSLANGQTGAQIENDIHSQALTGVDKNSNEGFAQWVTAVGVLVENNYYKLSKHNPPGNWILLPHGSPTDELSIDVHTVVGNTFVGNFVAHKHPGASGASVGQGYASNLHIKPIRGNTTTPRVRVEKIPQVIKNLL